jgi:hypothetical protein
MNDEMEGASKNPIGEGIISSQNSQVPSPAIPTRVKLTVDSKKSHDDVGTSEKLNKTTTPDDSNESAVAPDPNSNTAEQNDGDELPEKRVQYESQTSHTTTSDAKCTTQLSANVSQDLSDPAAAAVSTAKETMVLCSSQSTLRSDVEGNDRVSLDRPPKEALVSASLEDTKPSVSAKTETRAVSTSENRVDSASKSSASEKPARPLSTLGFVKQTTGPSEPVSSLPSHAASLNPVTISKCSTSVAEKPPSVSVLSIPSAPNVGFVPHTSTEERLPAVTFQMAAQQAAEEEAIAAARAPLSNIYGSYLCHSKDSSLADARRRLRNAISQTRDLRQTFSERVYGKYRVCLQPPPLAKEIIARIEADPAGQLRKLKEEIASIREEKEIEKKEAAKLNSEMNQSSSADRVPVLTNIDNAEQLMFLTAGLNLVVLPENLTDPEQLREYTDRYTTVAGQRVRSTISQAAATAGEVILDRTRKAAAMRVERQRRRQLQLLRGDVAADGESESNYSRLQLLAVAGSSATNSIRFTDRASKSQPPHSAVGTKSTASSTRRTTTMSGKGGRTRSVASLPTNTLLSLNPMAEEVKAEGKTLASTSALIARGVGLTATKTTQQRLKHPHPESLGGRRRANTNPGSLPKKDDEIVASSNQPEPFLQAYLANTLPPLPASKERLERKRLPEEVMDTPASRKTHDTIRHVLSHFVCKNPDDLASMSVSKITLLNGLRKQFFDCGESAMTKKDPTDIAPVSPALTLSVLHALGIVGRSQHEKGNQQVYSPPALSLENRALCSDKLTTLHGKIVSSCQTKLTQCMSESTFGEQPRKRIRSTNSDTVGELPPRKAVRVESVVNVEEEDLGVEEPPVMKTVLENSSPKSKPEEMKETLPTVSIASTLDQPKKRKRSASSPTRLSTSVSQTMSQPGHSQFFLGRGGTQMNFLGASVAGTDQFEQTAVINVFHLANQLSHMHHPAAGDLAEYLGSLQSQHQGYDLPSLVSGAFSPQLSALGFMQPTTGFAGYTLQERAATARAMLLREQQAAAILGGYPIQTPGIFPQVVPHQYLPVETQNVPMMVSQQDVPGHAYKSDDSPSEEAQESTIENVTARDINNHSQCTDQKEQQIEKSSEAMSIKGVSKEDRPTVNDEPADNQGATPLSGKSDCGPGSGGLTFLAPSPPLSLLTKHVELIQSGMFHVIAAEMDQCNFGDVIDFLLSVSAAIPLPKGLILGPLKERLNTPGFKSVGSNTAPSISRDVVAAVIVVWLWATREHTFQQAFEKNGRIDVDPDCKWLIQASVDTAVGELSLDIAESMARGEGAFAEAAALRKANVIGTETELSRSQISAAAHKVDVCTASIVSKALSAEMCVNDDMNSVVPISTILIDFLDEARLGSLRAKSQERVLLANLLSRTTLMSESFAHAYVSAMVRAGEALKHGRLFELVQDEEVTACTMMPYDIFTDDTGGWEDPCKPDDGFVEGLTGDELMHRAHARAMIQKSVRKLQDRHHVRGGTPTYGPFVDSTSDSSRVNIVAGSKDRPSLVSQRSGIKRRGSSLIENPVVPGTGSAAAKSWSVFHPRHFSSQLEWDPDEAENLPYGLHPRNVRVGFLSVSSTRHNDQHKDTNRVTSGQVTQSISNKGLCKSTYEIDWVDIAGTFQSVEVPRKTSRYKTVEPEAPVAVDGTIFAPFFCEVGGELSSDDAESDTEEDLSETTVLSRHQVVLDKMKAKLEAYLEARRKQQELRKHKYSK